MRRLVGATSAVVVSLAVVLAPPAGADPPEAYGWWSRARPALPGGVTVPAPTVPEGGLYVAGEPTAPAGVSALRLTLPTGAHVGEVTLALASAQGEPAVQACVATVIWTPEQGGDLQFAPASNCSEGLAFAAVSDGKLRIPAGGLVREGMLNIVLEPVPGSVFQASFDPPTGDTIEVVHGGSGPGEEDGFEGFDPGALFALPVTSASAPFDLPLGATLPPPALDRAPASGPSRAVPGVVRPSVSPPLEGSRARLLAAALLLNLVFAYLWTLTQATHSPRALGPMARYGSGASLAAAGAGSVELRGVGRFARPRLGPPPRL
ncbi:MAG TPA: hypothetical protein VM840_00700 [Actinomycetota bacterium]|nr:hypothetical protein [Actinomycetota bacterium]